MIWCLTRMMYQGQLIQTTALAEPTGVGVLKVLPGSRDGVHLQALVTIAVTEVRPDTIYLEIVITACRESGMMTIEHHIGTDRDKIRNETLGDQTVTTSGGGTRTVATAMLTMEKASDGDRSRKSQCIGIKR